MKRGTQRVPWKWNMEHGQEVGHKGQTPRNRGRKLGQEKWDPEKRKRRCVEDRKCKAWTEENSRLMGQRKKAGLEEHMWSCGGDRTWSRGFTKESELAPGQGLRFRSTEESLCGPKENVHETRSRILVHTAEVLGKTGLGRNAEGQTPGSGSRERFLGKEVKNPRARKQESKRQEIGFQGTGSGNPESKKGVKRTI